MSQVTQAILSAQLKAEEVRIRTLKARAQKHLQEARALRLALDPEKCAKNLEYQMARTKAYFDLGGKNYEEMPPSDQLAFLESLHTVWTHMSKLSGIDTETKKKHIDEHMDMWARIYGATGCPAQRARCANLALGFLRGRKYCQVENKTHTPLPEMHQMSKEISSKADVSYKDIIAWIDESWPNDVKEKKAA